MEVPATLPDLETVLLYGHIDKQPPFEGWNEGFSRIKRSYLIPILFLSGLSAYNPVLTPDGKLYGRGGADDGWAKIRERDFLNSIPFLLLFPCFSYAAYAAISAIHAIKRIGGNHGRCVIILECCEESGSRDLPAYVDHLSDRIGSPALVICLDSGWVVSVFPFSHSLIVPQSNSCEKAVETTSKCGSLLLFVVRKNKKKLSHILNRSHTKKLFFYFYYRQN